MGVVSDKAASQVNLFEGMCYITPLIGALMADSVLGRYKTILLASSIYLGGMVLLTLSASVPYLSPISPTIPPTGLQYAILYISLAIIALGTGGIKPVVSVFGADQFDDRDPKDQVEKASFFNWFYFVVNVGSLLAATVVVYIQENQGWGLGFAIPTFAMLMAIVCFVSGRKKYRHAPTAESPIVRVAKVLYTAAVNRWKLIKFHKRDSEPILDTEEERDRENLLERDRMSADQIQAERKQKHKWLNWAIQDFVLQIPEVRQFDNKYRTFTKRQVEEVRIVLGLVPYFGYMIFYWLIYQQMTTMFVLQGEYMERSFIVFGRPFRIPSASMSTFNTLGIIALIPLYDQGFIPLLKKYGKSISNLQRTGWGFVVAAFAMFYSAAIEGWRLKIEHRNMEHPKGRQEHLNIFWLAGAYLLVGLSEILSSIGQIEFFYDQAPDAMRSTASALSLLSTAFGSFLASFLISIIQFLTSLDGHQGWVPRNLNNGRLDLFYTLCGGLILFVLLFYVWSSKNYQYSQLHRQEVEKQQTGDRQQDTSAQSVPINVQRQESEDYYYGRSVVVQPITPAMPNPLK